MLALTESVLILIAIKASLCTAVWLSVQVDKQNVCLTFLRGLLSCLLQPACLVVASVATLKFWFYKFH